MVLVPLYFPARDAGLPIREEASIEGGGLDTFTTYPLMSLHVSSYSYFIHVPTFCFIP